jgi:hypothetical protein
MDNGKWIMENGKWKMENGLEEIPLEAFVPNIPV